MENYHVLVGPQAKIDGMKEILKPFNDQKWKVTVREQAIWGNKQKSKQILNL